MKIEVCLQSFLFYSWMRSVDFRSRRFAFRGAVGEPSASISRVDNVQEPCNDICLKINRSNGLKTMLKRKGFDSGSLSSANGSLLQNARGFLLFISPKSYFFIQCRSEKKGMVKTMLTGLQVAVLGGDARQLEIIRKLTELDAKVYLVGFDQLEQSFAGAVKEKLEELPFHELDALILPVAGLQPTGEIETVFSSAHPQLTKTMLSKTPDHCLLFTGISPPVLTKLAEQAGRTLIRLFDRDDVAIYNSIPTAEGAVMMAIQHTDFTIHGSSVAVLGMGRVGMSVARTFANLGANVKLGARKSEHLARAIEMGLTPFSIDQLPQQAESLDLIINTIPSLVITSQAIAKMKPHVFIIDLASKPGGTDFQFAKKRGIKAILALGLPGIVAPKTAGQILAGVITDLLKDAAITKGE
ncbi:Dipicolinate synthase subunit A [Bacillus badius]|uniref:Dipicolinate synthase subunit A n=2 Tax=Bacillus badius TaxID=1455 RepID=A0ABR5B0W5_BACBA|nr:Dipicolinate synthase subunit A [Bacillus badius]